MTSEPQTKNEYYENGQLFYTETTADIVQGYENEYPNRRERDNGTCFIRVGNCTKYHKTGVRAWQISYDDKGNVLKPSYEQRRADNTIIQY